jgi:hypothetical protein
MNRSDPEARRQRAAARASWPIHRTTLGAPDSERVDASLGERVAMVYELTLAAWAMSGRPMPTYRRSEMPGRVLRP